MADVISGRITRRRRATAISSLCILSTIRWRSAAKRVPGRKGKWDHHHMGCFDWLYYSLSRAIAFVIFCSVLVHRSEPPNFNYNCKSRYLLYLGALQIAKQIVESTVDVSERNYNLSKISWFIGYNWSQWVFIGRAIFCFVQCQIDATERHRIPGKIQCSQREGM